VLAGSEIHNRSVNARSNTERGSVSGEPEGGWAILSRRSLLQGAAAARILGATPDRAAAQQKISKVAVNYRDHPDGDKRCETCVQFQPPNACKVVEGAISPQGSCRIFMLRRA
jgi:hypothetical protein